MNDEQLALAIGNAVLDAIKTYQPEPKTETRGYEYFTPKQLAYNYGKSLSTIRTVTKEIREQMDLNRYPPDSILDGCGVMIRRDIFEDYLHFRKALRDPIGWQYVPEFSDEKKWEETL